MCPVSCPPQDIRADRFMFCKLCTGGLLRLRARCKRPLAPNKSWSSGSHCSPGPDALAICLGQGLRLASGLVHAAAFTKLALRATKDHRPNMCFVLFC